MLTALALASSLWVAAQEAGARPEAAQAVVVPVEKIADEFGRDMAWLVGSHAADLYSTAWALHRGANVTEKNPLGPTAEARIALKMAGCASTGLTLWKLRRDGHGRSATIVRWSYVAINGLLVVNNARHALKGK